MSLVDLSIIIVNWNTKELVTQCIRSIVAYTRTIEYEIILVDNHSEDGSVLEIREHFPAITVIQNEENLGFARAHNRGIRNAQGRYLLLLNSDTYIDHNVFGEAVRFMDAHPECGVLSPQIVNSQLVPYPMRVRPLSPLLSLLKIFNLYFLYQEYIPDDACTPIEVQVVGGSCMFMRREVIDSVGYLEEGFFLYNEEDDFCRRAVERGWKIIFNPQHYLIHLHGMTTIKKDIYERVQIEAYKSDLVFFSKYYSTWTALLLKRAYQFTFILKILKSCVGSLSPSLRKAAKRKIGLRWRMLKI